MPSYERRGEKRTRPLKAGDILLPTRPFLYTVDQIAVLLNVTDQQVITQYLYLEGRTIGIQSRSVMIARNIAPDDARPDWRVAEYELIRWFKWKGYKFYDRGYVTH